MMTILRLLSGLVARAIRRKVSRAPAPASRALSWYESTPLNEWCEPDRHCDACRADGDCDRCDTIDGRCMDAIAEHSQTCDGCGELTKNESLTMNPATRLLYCRVCSARGDGEEWAYKAWECGHRCGEATVFTGTDAGGQDCPGCGVAMISKRRRSCTGATARHQGAGGLCG